MQALAVKLAALTAAVGALFFALTGVASAAVPGSFTTLTASGATTLKSTVTVTGLITGNGGLTIAAGKATSLGGTLSVTGATTLKGNLTVGTSKFTVAALTGNTVIAGTLTSKSGTFTASTASAVGLTVKGVASQTGDLLQLKNSTGSTLAKFDKAGKLTAAGLTTGGTLGVTGATTLGGTLAVTGASTFNGNVGISGTKTLTVGTGTTHLGGALTVSGASTFTGLATVNGGLAQTGTDFSLDSSGNLSAANLGVTGTISNTGIFLVDASGNVQGANLTAGKQVAVSGTYPGGYQTTFSVDGATGNTHVYGGLTVDGTITLAHPTDLVSSDGFTAQDLTAVHSFTVNDGGTISLPDNSIVDSALSNNVALLSSSPAFTGDLSAASLSTGGTLDVTGDSTLGAVTSGDLTASSLSTGGNLDVTGDTTLTGTLDVTGDSTLGAVTSGALTADSLSTGGDLSVTGNTTLTGTLDVTGATTLGSVTADSLTVSNLTVSGPTISHMASAPNAYDMSGGSQALSTDDLLTTGLAVIQANGASQVNALSTPSAAAIVAAMPVGTAVGDVFHFTLVNADTGTNQIVAGGAGVTIAGASYVRYATEYTFTCRVTNVTGGSEAVTCY